jgi:hypothetical protein
MTRVVALAAMVMARACTNLGATCRALGCLNQTWLAQLGFDLLDGIVQRLQVQRLCAATECDPFAF